MRPARGQLHETDRADPEVAHGPSWSARPVVCFCDVAVRQWQHVEMTSMTYHMPVVDNRSQKVIAMLKVAQENRVGYKEARDRHQRDHAIES